MGETGKRVRCVSQILIVTQLYYVMLGNAVQHDSKLHYVMHVKFKSYHISFYFPVSAPLTPLYPVFFRHHKSPSHIFLLLFVLYFLHTTLPNSLLFFSIFSETFSLPTESHQHISHYSTENNLSTWRVRVPFCPTRGLRIDLGPFSLQIADPLLEKSHQSVI